MKLARGETAKRLGYRRVADALRRLDRLAPDHLADDAACGDGGAATLGLPAGIANSAVNHLDAQLGGVATLGIGHQGHAVGVFDFTGVARVKEMVQDQFVLKQRPASPRAKPLAAPVAARSFRGLSQ